MVAYTLHITADGEYTAQRIHLGRVVFHGQDLGNPSGKPGIGKVDFFLAF